ncbi:MAG: hypothetical protein EXS37_18190 [Opitutus sp.]|nr:hypothetical protein [Opitutus sp.]
MEIARFSDQNIRIEGRKIFLAGRFSEPQKTKFDPNHSRGCHKKHRRRKKDRGGFCAFWAFCGQPALGNFLAVRTDSVGLEAEEGRPVTASSARVRKLS